MEVMQGQVVTVTRALAGSDLIVDAAATDTVLFVDDVATFDEAGGSVDVGGTIYGYSAVDPDVDSITLTSGLAGAAAAYDTFVAVSPSGPIHTAEVVFADGSGVTVPARVPQHLRALLHEGVRAPDEREAVWLLKTGDDWLVLDIEFRAGQHNASDVPIIVTTENGESVRIDGDGISTFTNDPVPVRTIAGAARFFYLATDGDHLYAHTVENIYKYDAVNGEQVTSGFPIAGTFDALAVDGGFLYALDATTDDIRKFNASTGVETIGSGFPIAGTFVAYLAAADGYLYVVDDATDDIRKYDASDGSQVVVGFPIAGTFHALAAADGFLYAVDDVTDAIRKFDVSTGVEDTNGFPIPVTGPYRWLAISEGQLYATSTAPGGPGGHIHKYVADTGVEDTSNGFPVVGYSDPNLGAFFYLAAGGGRLFARDQRFAVRVFNIATGYQSTLTDSSAGTWQGHAVTVSDLTALGNTNLHGPVNADNLLVTTTKMSRVAAQNSSGAGTPLVVDFDTFEGSGTSGATAFWSESGGTITIDADGVYDISALPIVAANITGGRRVRLLVNGAAALDRFEPSASASVSWKFPLALKLFLSAGDTIQLEIQQTSGATLSVAGSWLTIARAGVLAA